MHDFFVLVSFFPPFAFAFRNQFITCINENFTIATLWNIINQRGNFVYQFLFFLLHRQRINFIIVGVSIFFGRLLLISFFFNFTALKFNHPVKERRPSWRIFLFCGKNDPKYFSTKLILFFTSLQMFPHHNARVEYEKLQKNIFKSVLMMYKHATVIRCGSIIRYTFHN